MQSPRTANNHPAGPNTGDSVSAETGQPQGRMGTVVPAGPNTGESAFVDAYEPQGKAGQCSLC